MEANKYVCGQKVKWKSAGIAQDEIDAAATRMRILKCGIARHTVMGTIPPTYLNAARESLPLTATLA